MNTVENGNTIKVHYKGTLDDGTEFDNSRSRGEVLSFQVGTGQRIPGFDTEVVGMGIGEVKTFKLDSDAAYGPVHEEAYRDFPKDAFGPDVELEIDSVVHDDS